jgi:hypothetical protein
VDDDRRRCYRGFLCKDAETVVDVEGRRVSVGALTGDEGRAYCPTCVRYLRYALNALPLDIAELSTLLAPTMQISYKDPLLLGAGAPRVKLHAPLPLDGNAEALQALIDHEVTSWAESTAREAGVAWDTWLADHSRQGARVQAGCQLLAYRLEHFLGLPPVPHRVRSTGLDPLDGWDPDVIAERVYERAGDVWIDRDGTEGATVLFDLHDQVEGFVGRTPARRIALPCPKCQRPTLVREYRSQKVVCRFCFRTWTDDEYETFVDVTATLFEVPR